MRRRKFIAGLGGTAAWPLLARAQRPVMPVIGFLSSGVPDTFASYVGAFRRGLAEVGFIDGQHVTIEFRWANGQTDRLPSLAADLVRRRVAVIAATGGTASAQAAKAATATIPIVFTGGGDVVGLGLVASLNRPGGNVTGVSMLSNELGLKRLELLVKLIPQAAVIGLVANPKNPNFDAESRDIQNAAHMLGKQAAVARASSASGVEQAFATLVRQQAGAVIIAADPFFDNQREQFVTLAARYALPAMYFLHGFVEAGGLMTYGTSITDAYRQAGIYSGRILKGERPAELPVMQASKFEFVLNLRTARTLGIEVPPTLLAIADEVIE